MTSFSSPKARRLGLMLALCLAIETSAPAPASAWFGWLDKWSGPGPFWGLLYDMRLVCFGPDSGIEEVMSRYQQAQQSTRLALGIPKPGAIVPPSAVNDWLLALNTLHAAQIRWNAPEEYRSAVGTMIKSFQSKQDVLVEAAEKAVRDAIESRAGQLVTVAGTGVFWSFCSDARERRLSIELNVNDWHSFDNENNAKFSGGTSIRFLTVMPSVTWRVFANQKADVLDLGIAAGYYAFSSKGFESVNGFIVEPLRIDLHAPPSWSAYPRTNPKRLASLFTVRAGLMTIPSGFAANAFARGSHEGRIQAEMVPTVGFFFNMNSLLSRKPMAPTIPSASIPGPGASRPPGAAAPW